MPHYYQRTLVTLFLLLTFLLPLPSCSSNKTDEKKQAATKIKSQLQKKSPGVITISSDEQFKAIIDTSGDRLLIFDLYADWCMPCKYLLPILEELAQENAAKASFYKINVDVHTQIAGIFGVSGIPFVVFVKNKTGVHALTGLNPKETYQRAINEFGGTASPESSTTPDG